ncbi:MAG: enoyl-CoA hydratase/isomerase family protein [Alphaproteobacteria bacterium]
MTVSVQPAEQPHILGEVISGTGWLTLNRPGALNALDLQMVTDMQAQLEAWAVNPDVRQVVVQGKGRAFCAGGDIRLAYEAWKKGFYDEADAFFRLEYSLNLYVHEYSKPYVAILDGITLGGGMGVSIHGSHRIVTERARLGMPETIIGYFPDVGSSYFLNQCPGESGLYAGLTGNQISPADALYMGLATHYMPSKNIPKLVALLQTGEDLEIAIKTHELKLMQTGAIQEHINIIDTCFGQDSVEDIFKALASDGSTFALETFETLKTRCPQSLEETFALFRRARDFSGVAEAIEEDYRKSKRLGGSPNFIEGIRAAVVDKDRNPKWV